MFQGNAFQQDAFQEVDPFILNMGGDPAPLPMLGLILQYVPSTGIIPQIMWHLRQQGIS